MSSTASLRGLSAAGVLLHGTCLENCEIAICGARCTEKLRPFLVTPDEIPLGVAGVLNWKRDLYNLIDERYATSKLCIVEAFNHPGNWSSYPPHKHARSELPVEGVMQEIYFFRYNLPQGFGFQAVYTDDGQINETYRVQSNDAVEVPRGYHPYVCAPGYYGYMLWLMAGEKRGFYRRTAPEHAWIDALEIVEKKRTAERKPRGNEDRTMQIKNDSFSAR
jgi:5-deoxy-glucuronate isomerase